MSGLTLIADEIVSGLTLIVDNDNGQDGARVNSKQACVWIDIDS